MDGQLNASSGDGHIRVDGRLDVLNLSTNDGRIDARVHKGSRMSKDWNIHTADGDVSLRLPDDFQADLQVHTGDGKISSDYPIAVIGRPRRSEFRGKLNGGGLSITARSGDGSIRILKSDF